MSQWTKIGGIAASAKRSISGSPSSTSTNATADPWRTNASTIPSPMPEAPPLTITRLPARPGYIAAFATAGEIPSATRSTPCAARRGLGVELDRGEALFARAVARPPGAPERHVIVDAGGGQVHHDHAGAEVLAEIADVLGTV